MKFHFDVLKETPLTKWFSDLIDRGFFRINWFWVTLFFIFAQFLRAIFHDRLVSNPQIFQLQQLPFWKMDISLWACSYFGSFMLLWSTRVAFFLGIFTLALTASFFSGFKKSK